MAPDEMSDAVETPDEKAGVGGEAGGAPGPLGTMPVPRRSDPRQLTTRERRKRWILLTVLLLLLALLAYLAYYFAMNRRLPSMTLTPSPSTAIAPPSYLYSISADGAASLVRPVGLGVADDGRVYVVDFGHRRVSVFTNPGKYLFSFGVTPDGPLYSPVHLAVKGNEIWVSERYYRCIYVYDLAGKYLRKFVPKNEKLKWTPLAFSFDATGAMRATEVSNSKLHRLMYFSADGSRTVTVGKTGQVNAPQEGPGTFMFPNGVAIAQNGNVYVSDGDNRRVQVFDAAGTFVRFVDTSGVPRGIAIDSKKRLYVADALAHTIAVYDLDGKQLTQFGERGFGPGQFNYPNDIAIDKNDRIYITDRENNQVQVWGWPVAQLPPITPPTSPWAWLALLACLIPLLLLPFLLARRRKIRIVVTPDFIDRLIELGEISAVAQKSRLRLIAPMADEELYTGRVVDGVNLGELLTFEEYSESDAHSLRDRLRVEDRPAILLSMTWRAKALGTEDRELRLLALVAEVRVVDVREFREIYLDRDQASLDAAEG